MVDFFHADQKTALVQRLFEAALASNRSMPANSPAAAVIVAFSAITWIGGRSARSPISKSTGSWAGVTLTAPLPNEGSTASSATIGISRSMSGSRTIFPIRSL